MLFYRRPAGVPWPALTGVVHGPPWRALCNDCVIPVYCFMPEHLHLIIKGMKESSDVRRVVSRFKQRTGYWFSKNSQAAWQRDFHDHIVRDDESLANHVWYIVNNPVRRGLVERWENYAYTGSIGVDLREVLSDLLTP